MLTEQDASDLIRLEFPETATIKNFSARLEILAQKTDVTLGFPRTEKTAGILQLVNYLFVHGSRYVQVQLIDHYFKLLKKVKCRFNLKRKVNMQKDILPADTDKFQIHYRWRCTHHYSRLTLITIKS
ncbi:hypothetical protein [Sinomicrobium pectinilyticum]|uniref:hypothetical protein n=1 Tax=Sinomicrobium pectinilyticum TaxID=1084421 RepID=UPI001473D945|nr:hypothetical protein [Sinomicrobium pectinilyticum]